jgi:hypothetical protein
VYHRGGYHDGGGSVGPDLPVKVLVLSVAEGNDYIQEKGTTHLLPLDPSPGALAARCDRSAELTAKPWPSAYFTVFSAVVAIEAAD